MSTTDKGTALTDAAQQNVETGVWLLCKEFLVTAIQDKRLERGHLRVLAAIVMLINHRSAKAWPDRSTIASMAGMSVSAVSNALSELRRWGYLIVDREYVESAGGRRLTVYTFGNIDHETIRAEITKFAERMQRDRDDQEAKKTSPPTVKQSSPPTVNITANGEATSPPTVKNSKKSSPQAVRESSPQAVSSNYIEGTTKRTATQFRSAAAQPDLLTEAGDPPPVVEIRFWKTALGVKPHGHPSFEPIHNSWILRHVDESELPLARDFVAAEVEQFFIDPPMDKAGKPIRLLGFVTSGFQHRWGAFRTSRASRGRHKTENENLAELEKVRKQLATDDE